LKLDSRDNGKVLLGFIFYSPYLNKLKSAADELKFLLAVTRKRTVAISVNFEIFQFYFVSGTDLQILKLDSRDNGKVLLGFIFYSPYLNKLK
jgi:hypothetical protein